VAGAGGPVTIQSDKSPPGSALTSVADHAQPKSNSANIGLHICLHQPTGGGLFRVRTEFAGSHGNQTWSTVFNCVDCLESWFSFGNHWKALLICHFVTQEATSAIHVYQEHFIKYTVGSGDITQLLIMYFNSF